jgi:threonine aldolase
MFFASDNRAGAPPEIVDAVAREAARFGAAYGGSPLDRAVGARFSEIFEREVAVFFVATGTAANGLALAAVAKPAGAVFCHRESHIVEDEFGGVEFLTGGARLVTVDGPLGKLDPGALEMAIDRFASGAVHSGQPMAVSITQMTEAGTVYTQEEIGAIADLARRHGLPLHMDGARFVNALVHLGVSPAEATWKAGVDLLSFGATKNGCIAAEALVIFDPARAKDARFLRQRAGHLFSKSRFVAAQFDAYFRDDLWLRLARHANKMGERLRAGLEASSMARLAWPTEGNETFAVLWRDDAERLRQAGAEFYEWIVPHGSGIEIRADEAVVRLVASFMTTSDHVDRFLGELDAETKTPRRSRGAKSG